MALGGGHEADIVRGVDGDSPLSDSEVQSSSSDGFRPCRCDRRWCFTMVVLRQKLLRQPSCEHLYGRLPVWILRCRARDEDCVDGQSQLVIPFLSLAFLDASRVVALYAPRRSMTLPLCHFRSSHCWSKVKLTSENRFPHPRCWHLWGFSPVCVLACTVRALRWMKLLPHPGSLQA